MHGTYEKKIFVIYLTLLLFLTTIITGGVVFYGLKISQKEKKHNREQLISSKKQQLDLQINIAFTSLINFRTSSLIETWAYSSEDEYYYYLLKVQDDIAKQQLSLGALDFQIGVTIQDENYSVITQSSSLSKDEYYKNVLGLNDKKRNELHTELKNLRGYNKYLIKNGIVKGKKKINYITLQKYGDREVFFYLTIDEENYYSSILDLNDGWLITYNSNLISKYISNSLSYLQTTDFDNIIDSSLPVKNDNRYFSYGELDGYVLPSTNQNMNYIYLYQEDKSFILKTLLLILIPYVLLCILCLGIAKFITSFLYKPVSTVIDTFSGESIGDKGFNEFEFINLKAEEIQNDNLQLKSLILKNSNLLLEKFHKDLLYGINTAKFDSYKDFRIEKGDFQVILFNIEEWDNTLENDTVFLAKNIIRAATLNSEKIQFVNIDYNSFVLILKVDSVDIEDTVKSLIINIEEEYDVVVIASVGRKVDDMKKVKISFNEANRIMEYKNSVGIKQILTIDDLKSFRDYHYFFPLNVENRLISGILNGNRSETKKVVELLLDENLLVRRLSYDRKRNFLFSLMSTINRIQQEKKIEGELFDNEMRYVLEILSLEDNKQIRSKVHELFEQIIGTVSSDKNNSNNLMAQEIMAYIHKNYSRDISLYDISQHLDITEKYSSILFKRVTGSNFKDVLNKHRITKAKQLLEKNSNIQIQELAGRVGFNSSNTFIRVFKKYVGLSPGAYALGENY
ncbi:MAG: helix-turn-helix domain-containing protein [Spirochaetaceae bacterium]